MGSFGSPGRSTQALTPNRVRGTPCEWGTEQVAEHLATLGYGEHADLVIEGGVDGAELNRIIVTHLENLRKKVQKARDLQRTEEKRSAMESARKLKDLQDKAKADQFKVKTAPPAEVNSFETLAKVKDMGLSCECE
jgi:hypothetical protein